MARQPRLVIPFQAHHILLIGNNKQAVFCDDDDYATWLGQLQAAARQYQVAIHAYSLLPGRVQLLVSPSDETGLARMMQWMGRHYVPYFNRKYQRSGSLWQGRFRTSLIDAERYLLLCSQYVEQQAMQAGVAGQLAEHRWSSYAHHIGVRIDPLITDHPLYWALGNTPFQREAVYRELCEQGIAASERALLDRTLAKGWPLASQAFQTSMEMRLQRRIGPAKRGRPARAPAS